MIAGKKWIPIKIVLLIFLFIAGAMAGDDKPASIDRAPELSGVVKLNNYECAGGYRFYSSRQTHQAHLIDIYGNVINSWSYPTGSWHYAEMLPNGHVIAIDKDDKTIELDWESNLVWEAEGTPHHDIYKYPGGNIIVLDEEKVSGGIGNKADDDSWSISYLREYDGNEVVWEWHQINHLEEIAAFIEDDWNMMEEFDGSHTNSIEVLPENPSGLKDSRFQQGNILIDDKAINTMFVIDKESKEVVWAKYVGAGSAQHMPTMLENGNIMYYDNNGHDGHPAHTRIVELDPITDEIIWEYYGDPPRTFYSRTRGSAEVLPNNNVLIAESDAGRMFEVNRDGEIVWEFLNPDRDGDTKKRQPMYRVLWYSEATVNAILNKHGKR